MHERESKSLFSRGLPHILSNEQGERGKFTIFYPFLLKERRLHTHEAECTRSRCAFWFQVSDPGTIQGDLSRWSSSTNKVNNFKLCAFPHFSRQINLNRQSYRIELILIPLFFVVSPRLKKHPNFVVDLFVVENLANLEIIPRKLLVNHAAERDNTVGRVSNNGTLRKKARRAEIRVWFSCSATNNDRLLLAGNNTNLIPVDEKWGAIFGSETMEQCGSLTIDDRSPTRTRGV